MIRPLLIATILAFAAPAIAQPNAQLVNSVEQRLAILGFQNVDASTLSTRQVAALHLELQREAFSFDNFNRINARSRVKVILGWD